MIYRQRYHVVIGQTRTFTIRPLKTFISFHFCICPTVTTNNKDNLQRLLPYRKMHNHKRIHHQQEQFGLLYVLRVWAHLSILCTSTDSTNKASRNTRPRKELQTHTVFFSFDCYDIRGQAIRMAEIIGEFACFRGGGDWECGRTHAGQRKELSAGGGAGSSRKPSDSI